MILAKRRSMILARRRRIPERRPIPGHQATPVSPPGLMSPELACDHGAPFGRYLSDDQTVNFPNDLTALAMQATIQAEFK